MKREFVLTGWKQGFSSEVNVFVFTFVCCLIIVVLHPGWAIADEPIYDDPTYIDSAYIELSASRSEALLLKNTPLQMSAYPTTLGMALSKQDEYLRSVDVNGQVWQWSRRAPKDRKLIATADCEPSCAAISDDGKWAGIADHEGCVSLIALDEQVAAIRDSSCSDIVCGLCFSVGARRFAAISDKGLVRVWNVGTGAMTHRFEVAPSPIAALAFSPQGDTLAVANFSPDVTLFDLSQTIAQNANYQRPESVAITIGQSRVTAIEFTPSGNQVVIAAADGTTSVYSSSQGNAPVTLETFPFATWSIAFDETGDRMVAGSWDGTTRIWDARNWRLLQTLKGHQESVCATIIALQGMVSAGTDGKLIFWQTEDPGAKSIGMITGPADPVWVAVHSPDGSRMYLGGRGKRSEMWDLETNQRLFDGPFHPTVRCAAFTDDGITIATGGDDKTIRVASAVDGKVIHTLTGHPGLISALAFIDHGKTLISGCDRGVLKFWDVAMGRETASRKKHQQQLYCAAVSPDQRWLVTGGGHWARGDPGELIVWDLVNRRFKKNLTGHRLTVWSIVFTPDGKQFASSDSAGEVKIWDSDTFELDRTLTHETWLRPLAISPDGKTLAVGQGDGSVRLWETETWIQKQPCNGNEEFTFWISFSPDGKSLASGGNDGTVRFWETP